MISPQILTILSKNEIALFCQRWKISELALFGSVLRDDFRAESDIDVLVAFHPSADWGLFDHVQMEQELKTIFRRNVDLITRRAVERGQNKSMREEILSTTRVIYSERDDVHVER